MDDDVVHVRSLSASFYLSRHRAAGHGVVSRGKKGRKKRERRAKGRVVGEGREKGKRRRKGKIGAEAHRLCRWKDAWN